MPDLENLEVDWQVIQYALLDIYGRVTREKHFEGAIPCEQDQGSSVSARRGSISPRRKRGEDLEVDAVPAP